jgi:hypothetical protein
MARNGLEAVIQPECSRFLNTIGWAYKAEVEMVCHRCHSVNYPKHSGMFDYLSIVRSDYGPYPIGVEVKATPDGRWRFADWSQEQRLWADAWRDKIASTTDNTFLWLQIGKNRVDSKDIETRRRVWLVPQLLVLKVEQKLLNSGVKSLPVNAAARTKGRDDLTQMYTADHLFAGWEMQWRPSFGWWPPVDSMIWNQLRIIYHEPSVAREFNTRYISPDIAAKRS